MHIRALTDHLRYDGKNISSWVTKTCPSQVSLPSRLTVSCFYVKNNILPGMLPLRGNSKEKTQGTCMETVVWLWFIDPKDSAETSPRIQWLWNPSSSLPVVLLSQKHGKLKIGGFLLFSGSENAGLMFFIWLGRTRISPPLDSLMFTYTMSAWSK